MHDPVHVEYPDASYGVRRESSETRYTRRRPILTGKYEERKIVNRELTRRECWRVGGRVARWTLQHSEVMRFALE